MHIGVLNTVTRSVNMAERAALKAHYAKRILKDKEHAEAVAYCKANGCRGFAAISKNHHKFTHITAFTINSRLDGKVVGAGQDASKSLLTDMERGLLVEAMVSAEEAGYPMNKVDRDQAVMDILEWRNKCNVAGGRQHVSLSQAALRVLMGQKPSSKFWRSFFVEFDHILKIKKSSETSIARAKQCSRHVAQLHIDAIKAAMANLGLYSLEDNRIVEGKEGNIIYMDEMGQFFNYLLARGSRANVVGKVGKGAPKIASNQNRGTFSVDAAMGGDGYMYDPHIIFAQDSLSADMVPPCRAKLPWLLISNTAKGCQTGVTFFNRLKNLEIQARDHGVEGPLFFATDGHASRFFFPLQKWITQVDDVGLAKRDMFLSPPNSTGTICWLDQLFQMLHGGFAAGITDLKSTYGMDMAISKWEAMSVICNIWRTWASTAHKNHAMKVCGFHHGRWSIDTIPPSNFALADKWDADEKEAKEVKEVEADPQRVWANLLSPSVASILSPTTESSEQGISQVLVAIPTEGHNPNPRT